MKFLAIYLCIMILFCTKANSQPILPPLFDLSTGDYSLSEWSKESPANTYPSNGLLFQYSKLDMPFETEPDTLWTLPYNLTSQSRIYGADDLGIGFVNTSAKAEGGGWVGAFELYINTSNASNVYVSWKTRTISPGERKYAIAFQYKTDNAASYSDCLNAYNSSDIAGDSAVYSISLPQEAAGKDSLFLRWKYCYISGESGTRAKLALDDIVVSANVLYTNDYQNIKNIEIQKYADKILIHANNINTFCADIYDLSGNIVLSDYSAGSDLLISTECLINGIYFLCINMGGKTRIFNFIK